MILQLFLLAKLIFMEGEGRLTELYLTRGQILQHLFIRLILQTESFEGEEVSFRFLLPSTFFLCKNI